MNIDRIRAVREQVDQYDDKGVCEIRLCFRCELYFSHFRHEAQGLRHFYETVLPLIRDSVRFYDVDGKRRPKKIKEEVFGMLPYWASLEDKERSIWGLSLESGATKDDKSDHALDLFSMYMGAGSITLFLPVEMALKLQDLRLRDLAHGVVLQAGAEPSFGDVNRGETLPAYHAAGRALRPLRAIIARYNGIGGQENTQEWLARFDN